MRAADCKILAESPEGVFRQANRRGQLHDHGGILCMPSASQRFTGNEGWIQIKNLSNNGIAYVKKPRFSIAKIPWNAIMIPT